MTDIPELQHLLIEAAGRRSGVRRRAKGARAVALVAVVALAVVALPRVDGADDVEIPAVPPPAATAAPQTIEAAYGVFRRPARATDRVMVTQMHGAETRRVAKTDKIQVFLAVKGERTCVVVRGPRPGATGTTCGPTQLYLGGYRLLGSTGNGPYAAAFAAPDGIRGITFTFDDGRRIAFPVTTNGLAVQLPQRAVRAEWIAPDGQPQRAELVHVAPSAKDLFVALNAAPGPAGELSGLPGSRRVLEADSTSAWLVPRRNAVCLVLKIGERKASGCRSPVTDARRPIVVALAGGAGERVVAAAFADAYTGLALTPGDGISRLSQFRGVILWSDRGEARTLTYRNVARGTARNSVPARSEGFVLNARAEPPETIPPP
jgi:hypothetical protein